MITGHEFVAVDTQSCNVWYSSFYPSDTVATLYCYNFCADEAIDSITVPGKLHSVTHDYSGKVWFSIGQNNLTVMYTCSPTLHDTAAITTAHGTINDIVATDSGIVCIGVFDSVAGQCIRNAFRITTNNTITAISNVPNDLLFCDRTSTTSWFICANGNSECLYALADTNNIAQAVSVTYDAQYGPDYGIRSMYELNGTVYGIFLGTDSVPSEESSTLLQYNPPGWIMHNRMCGRSFLASYNDTLILYGSGVRTHFFDPKFVAYFWDGLQIQPIPLTITYGFPAYLWSKDDTIYAIGNFTGELNSALFTYGLKIFRGAMPSGVKNISGDSFIVSPNPSSTGFHLYSTTDKPFTFFLYDVYGSIIATKTVTSGEEIPTPYPRGMYFIRTDNTTESTHKFILK